MIALIASLHATAQQWCPPGAEWSFAYSSVNWSTGETQGGVLLARYTGDSLVGGYTAQRIEQNLYYQMNGQGDFINESWGHLHTRQDEGVVYLWTPGQEQYDTLMWFGASPGDQWPVAGMVDHHFMVLDTATVIMEGIPLRRLVVQNYGVGLPLDVDTLHERIGFDQFYIHPTFTQTMMWDGPIGGLFCYRDNVFSYLNANFNVSEQNCGFTMSIPQAAIPKGLSIYPNPGSNRLWIESIFDMRVPQTVRIRDARGAEVGVWRMSGNVMQFDTDQWPSGLYLVEAMDDRHHFTARWLKQ